MEERVEITKRPVIVEEVIIGKNLFKKQKNGLKRLRKKKQA